MDAIPYTNLDKSVGAYLSAAFSFLTSLFKNLSVVHVSSFPIGSNHITKDISRGCYLSEIESELIKKELSIIDDLNENEFLSNNYFSETKFRKISSKFVQDIISARLDEILNKIFKEINFLQNESIKQNLIFTGGGSKLNDLKKPLVQM